MRDALVGERIAHHLRLTGRYDPVLVTLQQQHGHLELVDVGERGALDVEVASFRVGADEPVDVAGLEVVGVLAQPLEVGDPVAGDPGGEGRGAGQAGQHRPAARAAALDRQPLPVGDPLGDQMLHHGDGVGHVDHAPLAPEPIAVGASVTGRAAVVDLDDAEAPGGVVRHRQAQHGRDVRGGTAVDAGDERRQLPLPPFEALLTRPVDDRVDHAAVRQRHLDALGRGQHRRIGGVLAGGAQLHRLAEDRGRRALPVEPGQVDRREAGGGGPGEDHQAVGPDLRGTDQRERAVEPGELPAAHGQHRQRGRGAAVLDQGMVSVEHLEGRLAQLPHGAGELLLGDQHLTSPLIGRPQPGIPPAGLVGDEQQALIVEPFRLQDGDVSGAGDHGACPGRPADQRGHMQPRAVPGHLRMLPAQPGQAAAVRAQPRVGDEPGGRRDAADRGGVVRRGAVQRDRSDVALDVRGAVGPGARALLAAGVVLADPPHLLFTAGQGDRGGAGPAQRGPAGGGDLGADG